MRQLSLPNVHRFRDFAPFVIRGPMGVIFAYHGWQKFDNGLEGFSGFVDSLGVPLPDIVGPAVALLELVGGCMIVAGLLTRIVALLLAIEMIGTTWLVKLDIGLIGQQGAGAEIDVALWAGMVALALLGPGILALDRVIGIERK
ncbi:MAG: DoxX family protein [Actinomycetota bacterium]